jgi:hypothetical protein
MTTPRTPERDALVLAALEGERTFEVVADLLFDAGVQDPEDVLAEDEPALVALHEHGLYEDLVATGQAEADEL